MFQIELTETAKRFLEKLQKKDAEKEEISLSELCRRKLRENPQLDRIEREIMEIKKHMV